MIAECDECHQYEEVKQCPEYGNKWFCQNCFEVYEREDEHQNEPVPYPDADELAEDQGLV